MASNQQQQDEKSKKGEKKLQKSYFDVLGLCCSSEVPLIENILKPLEGVKEVSVIVPSRTVIVVHDTLVISHLQILKALNQARLEANIRVYGDQKHQKRWPSLYAVACGFLLLLSFLKYVYHPLKFLALGAVAAGIFPIILKAVVSIQNLRLDINILMIIAVVGTVAMNDYLEAGTIVFLFSIAEWLETRASHRANAVMSSLMNLAPQKAVIAETGEVVDADEVKVNTIIAVKAGEVIPIDGVVVDGNCEVDEKTLTGESFPVAKQKDSTVWAGTINLNGYISVKTTSLAEDCVVAKMAKLVEEAQNSKTSTQRLIDKFAKFYTPAVVVISTLVAVIPIALKVHNERHWLHFALVVLVSACPCALVLSTPVATFCAYSKAATSGLLIKGGDHLETLAKIKVMAFDKTGTITKGEFVVTNFLSLSDDIDLNTLLYWVSSVESKSSHPLAAAIVDYGRSLSIEPKPEEVTEFDNFPGEGICGKIDGRVLYIGNKKITTRAGSETVPALQGEFQRGKTTGYIYSGATLVGFFSLSDACRTGAQDAIGQLRSLGIKSAMLTGDSQASAMQAQEQLGNALELVHAELLPEDKVNIVSEFKKEGPTAMVGDGLNDAPALATADIGISMGISGSALASETGNIILMSNDLRKIPEAIKLARKSHRKVIENIILSVITKAAILGLAIGGHPIVWAAVLADVGTCLLVILNSMLLLRGGHKHGGKSCKSSTQHAHKHGCGGTNGGSSHHHHHHQHKHQHHSHKNCCSDKTKQVSEPQKCGSQTCSSKCQPCPSNSSVGGTVKHHNVMESHDQCKGNDEFNEPDHCHGGTNSSSSHNHHHHHHHHHHDGGSSHLHQHQHHVHKHSCSDKTKQHHHHQHQHHNVMESHDELHEQDGVRKPDIKQQGCSDSRKENSNAGHNAAVHGNCLGHKSHGTDHCHNKDVNMNHGCENPKDHHESIHMSGPNHAIEHQHSGSHSDLDKYETDEITIEIANQSASKHGCSEGKENNACCNNVCSAETCEVQVVQVECDCESPSSNERQVIISPCCRDDEGSSKESRVVHGCMSLEKRGVGGCCKSYMKECCVKHGHAGAGFVGGLSEIITE